MQLSNGVATSGIPTEMKYYVTLTIILEKEWMIPIKMKVLLLKLPVQRKQIVCEMKLKKYWNVNRVL